MERRLKLDHILWLQPFTEVCSISLQSFTEIKTNLPTAFHRNQAEICIQSFIEIKPKFAYSLLSKLNRNLPTVFHRKQIEIYL